jgi:hypothetical protein
MENMGCRDAGALSSGKKEQATFIISEEYGVSTRQVPR